MDLQHTIQELAVFRTQPNQSLGCAIIDAQGNEVSITEEMIQKACAELDQRLVRPALQD
ncbi:PA1571 family protein [Pseudomonas sp.]|uniref:PA1571 family protein n=1 Tax=Pseudomonas sp. TaxID=306 RepID=UPI002616A21F|nr:PA1571 family protein [Pseudomonas sp.]